MDQVIAVEPRQHKGKGANRKLRVTGKIPGVLYGLGKNADLVLDPKLLTAILLKEGGTTNLFTLKGGELEGKRALIKDWQIDPVSRQLLHVDLLEVDPTRKVVVPVKLNFVGKAVGVADGGVLNIIERSIEIRVQADRIPQHIDVEVTALKIGASIHLSEIKLPEGVEAMSHTNPTLVTVVPPTKEEEAAPVLTQAAEPEVLTEKKKEGEEGAAPAAGGAEGKGKTPEKADAKKKSD